MGTAPRHGDPTIVVTPCHPKQGHPAPQGTVTSTQTITDSAGPGSGGTNTLYELEFETGWDPEELIDLEGGLSYATLAGYVSGGWSAGPSGEEGTLPYTPPPGSEPETPEEEEGEGWGHFLAGFIPVYGSARDMYNSYQEGSYGMAAFNAAMLAVDVTGVGALAKMGAKAGVKLTASAAKAVLNGGVKETIETGVKQGLQAAGSIGDNVASAAKGLADDVADVGKSVSPQCFPAGTLVSTEQGLRPIETVQAGEKVWAFDLSASQWKLRPVIETYQFLQEEFVELLLEGERLVSTAHHPFWVIRGADLAERSRPEHISAAEEDAAYIHAKIPGRWVDAIDLRAGDVLYQRGVGEITLSGAASFSECQPVYNFAVDDLHCYAVGTGETLVHNNCGDELVQLTLSNGEEVSSLSKEAIEELSRLRTQARTGRPLRNSTYPLVDYVDDLGRTYDQMGHPNMISRWTKQKPRFFAQIMRHLGKADFVVIDLTHFPQSIKNEVGEFILALSDDMFDQIITIGF